MYKREFPNYDDTLKIPKGYEDWSYHNDMMPCVGKRVVSKGIEFEVIIFQDYMNIDLRERDDLPRYHIHINVNCITIFSYSTDDWEEIEQCIRNENLDELKHM